MRDTQLVRFAAVLAVLAGYVFVFRADERRIGEQLDDNTRLAERIGAAQRTLASSGELEAQRTRLRAALGAVELDAGRSALVARFVHDAARIASAHHTTIAAITAGGAPAAAVLGPNRPPATAGAAAPADEPFEPIPLELAVEGRYADVLATVRELSATRVVAAVEVASLARKNADSADTTLTAALHVALQHFVPMGPSGVRARPV